MDRQLRDVAEAIADAQSVVALTGAGVSTASGIPAFRTEGGVWERHDPADFTLQRFQAEPGPFWDDWLALHDAAFDGGDVEPNEAHRALADLERAGHLDAVVTQNVDGLHQAAGSDDVVEIHGNADRAVCRTCKRRMDAGPVVERVRDGEQPPRCDGCEGLVKPDAVLFGERLPRHAHLRAQSLAEDADVFLVAGSSLTVEPAASLPAVAADAGAMLVVVNHGETPLADRVDYAFREDAGVVFRELADEAMDAAGPDWDRDAGRDG